MRKILLLAFIFLTSFTAFGQDFSNKGKDFWVGYGYHQQMTNGGGGGSQDMVLYFATEQVTNIVISIPATGYVQNITTPGGNGVVTSALIPKTGVNDARLLTEGLSSKGIHITSDKPMVAYAHIYNQSVSGATILYPTNTLGRENYSVNYKNWSNSLNSNCWFYVVATDTGTTTVKITPTGNTVGGWVSGNTYQVSLTQGQIYNVMGSLISSPNNCNPVCTGYDLTGSKIESINNGSGCKKIAVFSGSGRISITCNNNNSSSDNYMVQAMPKNAWGKKYLTVPANGNQANNIYRVCVSSPLAIVKINGVVTGLPLQNNFYYEIPSTNQPQLIEADSAIMVAQYFTSQGACGNGNPGDPEVIYLSAVEQNINKVLWNATSNWAITSHNFNVVIPNTGTALSSFRLNGAAVTGWITHPQDPNYSYLRKTVSTGFNVIQSDSGFNAIAYGFGNAESYGYNAGTNIKDLYQQIGVQTTYGIETTPSVCTNSPFKFKVSLPYIPDSMHWDFHGAAGMSPNNNTVYVDNTGNIAEDSSTVVNGKTIHWYSIPLTYTFSIIGTYPITITTFVPNGECGSQQDIDFDLGVSDPPVAGFTWTAGGCVAEPFQFTETTPQFPKTTYKFWWNFGDPGSGPNNDTSNVRNPVHTFSAPGTYTVRYGSITTPGCLSDTISHTVIVPDYPDATISGNTTACINTGTVPVTFTGSLGTAEYIFSYKINGGATLTTTPSTGGIYTINAPTNVAGPFIYTLVGVSNATPVGTPCTRVIAGQSITVNITPDATVTLRPGDNNNQTVCINTSISNIRYDVGGSGTGGAVSGLPAGVTGTYAAGVITITGTPTVPGTFNYTVTTTGPCLTPQATGTITVTDNATIALTSGAGSDNQTLCINTPLVINITYSVGGSGTGGSVTGLPAGITGVYGGSVITISGTPTATGVFNYTVLTTGPCVIPTATGTITVTGDGTLTLTSAAGTNNQTRCINVAITNITYAVGGTGTGGSVSGLPPGVTGVFAGGVITISGTPTAPGTFNYTVTTTGPCLTPQATGTITVNDNSTIALTSAAGTNNQTICINTSITNIDYLVAGGGTGATIAWTPGTPPGVNFIPLGGGSFRISGVLSATGTFNYTITTTGPCINPQATGSITVNPDHTIGFNGGNPNPTLCVNTLMPSFTLLIGGGATGITSAGLPPGVLATVGAGGIVTISGTPSSAIGSPFNYTITTTGNACLTASYSNTINVTDNATINHISGSTNQAVCRNTPIAAIDYSTAGSATGATIAWAPSAPTGITFTPLGGGNFEIAGTPTVVGTQTYTYTITTTGPCVNPTATGSITVNALPIASFTAAPIRCANRDISFSNTSTLNAASATYAWDFGDPPSGPFNTSPLQNPTHNYLVPNTTTGYTVTLTVTNSNSCVSNPVASMIVMVNDTPRADFLVPNVCINDVATVFSDISTINAGNSITSWFWDYGDPPSGPLNTATTQHGSHLYPSPNNYTVWHKAISNFGCRDSISHVVVISSADPLANFTATNSCSADSVSLINLSTVGFGNVTKLEIYWNNVGVPQVILNPIFNGVYKHKYPTLTTTQTYNIRMIAYSGVICFNQKISPVTVYATPVVQFNNIPNTCYLVAPFQLTQGSEIGGVPGTGTYSGPGITNPNGTFNPQIAGVGTHNIKYTWTASNPGACIDTLTRTITVRDTAHAKFSYVLPACEQTPVSFTDLSTAPGSVTMANTIWDFGDGTPIETHPSGSTFTHIFALPGIRTVTMHTVSTAATGGCLSTDTVAQLTIDANHVITWDATSGAENQTRCVNNAITDIKYQLSGGATGATVSGLPPGVTYSVTGNTLTITGAPTTATPPVYNYTVTTTGNGCALATDNGQITVDPDHTISLVAGSDTAQSVCVNTPIDDIVYDLGGGASGVTIANLPPGVTYTVAGNILTISGTPTTSAGGPMFNFAIQTTGNSCVKASTIGEILVNDYPVPNFTFDKSGYCIPNAIVKLTNASAMPDGSLMTYLWDLGDGTFPKPTSRDVTHQYLTQGPFNVHLSATSMAVLNNNIIGCTHDTTIALTTIHPQPKADFVFSKPSVCVGDNVTITDNTDGKDGIVNQWNWNMGDGTLKFINPVPYTYADTITYNITMYSINTHGCNSDTITKPFTVYPYPHVSAGPDKFVLEGGSVELESTSFANDPKYNWTPDLYLTDAKIARPRVMNPKTDMTYRLTVTGRGGCAISDDVFVKLLKFPVIPNTFTPNGDGINDTWRIDFLNTYPENRVQIFTRTGKIVFESRGYNTPWDGTIKGKPLPFDTYYYIIEPGNGRDPITGYVTILK
jgi:gliding motility-associated-like protein